MDNKLQIQALRSLLEEEHGRLSAPEFVNKLYAASLGSRGNAIKHELKVVDKLSDIVVMCLMQQNPHRALRYYIALKSETDKLEILAEDGMSESAATIIGIEEEPIIDSKKVISGLFGRISKMWAGFR